jgi:hypothetical protein
MKRRRRVKQIHSLEERLAEEAKELRERAKQLPQVLSETPCYAGRVTRKPPHI